METQKQTLASVKMSSSSIVSSEENISSTFSPGNPPSRFSSMEQQAQTFGKCPNCLVTYDFIKRTNTNVSKVPLLLPCKHTFCEDCIKKSHALGHIKCPTCNDKFPCPVSHLTKLPEHFSPHYALLGYLMWCKNGQMARKQPTRLEGGFISGGFTLSKRDRVQPSTESTEQDSALDEILQENHQEFLLSMEFDACPMHPTNNNFLNMTCETCNLPVCCYCFLEDHNGHVSRYLFRLSEEEEKELPMLKSAAQQVINQLHVTQKKVQELKSFDTDRIENEIRTYFSDLHGKLHVVEKQLRDKLPDLKVEDVDLEDIAYNVKSALFKAKHILKFFDAKSKNTQLNVRALYDEAKLLKNTPCQLVSDSGGIGQIQFLPTDSFDDIEDCFELKRSVANDYHLVPIEDFSCLPEAVEDSPPSQQRASSSLGGSAAPIERKPRNAALSNLQPRHQQQLQQHVHHQQQQQIVHNRHQKDSVKSVAITHLNDINSFFCQKATALHSLKEVNKIIAGKRTKEPQKFQLGRIYGALYTSKNGAQWRRAKVIDIVQQGNTAELFNVFYLDYGNTQLVSKEKLKSIGLPLANRAPFAFECKLHIPEGTVLPENARLHMAQIISEKELLVKFMKDTNNHEAEEVEVLVANSNGDLVSLVDIMSQTVKSSPILTSSNNCHRYKLYSNSKSFLVGQADFVVVSHVKDPYDICVQLQQNYGVLQQMKENMKVFYEKHYISCIPMEGSDVVVKHHDRVQGDWHRAHVVSVDKVAKTAEVYLVDWGVTQKVTWANIKMLTEEFTRVESQAISVQLADIEPANNEISWSEPATGFLKTQLSNTENTCKMVVNARDPLAVALFQTLSSSDLCLNALMVKAGFANGTGKLSETVNWLQNQVQEKINEEHLHTQLIKKSEEVIMEDSDPDVKSGIKQQVTIVRADSPSVIYIKFRAFKDTENEMFKYMQVHYGETKTRHQKKNWAMNEHCVVWDPKNNNFVRGRVVCGGDSNEPVYKVYLYDQARDAVVLQKNIYIYAKFFRDKYRQFVYKCHLANVKPAGDSGKWSQSAIEMLQEILDTYKTIYVKKVPGEIGQDGKSMPVLMWYEKTTVGNALQPSKQNFISVNKALVEAGLAFNCPYRCPQPPPRLATPQEGESETSSSVSHGENASQVSTSSASNAGASADETVAIDSENDVHSSTSPAHTLKDGKASWYDLVVEDETQQSQPVDDWLPPLPFTKTEFEAVLTYIDDEPMLSVCDAELHKMYMEMEKSLCEHFDFARYPKKLVHWRRGMMCTIHYSGKWYRGRVIADAPDDATEIAVIMIDFGSDHLIRRKDLYRQIMYPGLPPFVNSIRLYDVVSRYEHWLAEDIDKLINEVVTDTVTVHIKDSLDVPIPFAEVFRNTGESINQMIANLSPNLLRLITPATAGAAAGEESEDDNEYEVGIRVDVNNSVVNSNSSVSNSHHSVANSYNSVANSHNSVANSRNSVANSHNSVANSHNSVVNSNNSVANSNNSVANSKNSVANSSNSIASNSDEEEKETEDPLLIGYNYVPLPESPAKMYVLNVISYDSVVLDVLNQSSSHADALVTLHDEIKQSAESQPVLKNLELYQPCICKQSETGIWRRSYIENLDNVRSGFVMAFLVDLGIVDIVDCESIKAMKPEWFDIPVSNYLAKIHIKLEDRSPQTVDFVMRQQNSMVNKALYVKILSRDPLHVHLFENNQLCYQKLLDYSIFALA